MTRKDYELIAGVIRNMPDHAASLRAQKQSCAWAFADKLESDNPRFDCKKFLAACGIEEV